MSAKSDFILKGGPFADKVARIASRFSDQDQETLIISASGWHGFYRGLSWVNVDENQHFKGDNHASK